MTRTCIIIDTREQRPLDFSPFPEIRTERREIWPGDYSLKAYSRRLAIERKSVADFIGTMVDGYRGLTSTTPARFDRELLGLGGIINLGGRAFILVEPDAPGETAEEQLRAGHYRAMIPPATIAAFVKTLRHGWRIPIVFAASREHAAEIVVAACKAAEVERKSWKPFDRMLAKLDGFSISGDKC